MLTANRLGPKTNSAEKINALRTGMNPLNGGYEIWNSPLIWL